MMEELPKNLEHNSEINRELLTSAIREILLNYYAEYNLKKREIFSMGFMSQVILEYSQKSGPKVRGDDLSVYNNLMKEIIDIIEENIADRQAGRGSELLTEISDDYINIIKRAMENTKQTSIKATGQRLEKKISDIVWQGAQEKKFDDYKKRKDIFG